MKKVVITGIGMLCASGNGKDAAWAAIRAGKPGIGRITQFDASNCTSQVAAEVKDFQSYAIDSGLVDAKSARHMARFSQFAVAVAKAGVKSIIYTDTATDGMLGGPNLTQMAAICDAAPGCAVTASGGVSSPYDVKNLMALGRANLVAAIVGKALYDGRTTLRELNLAGI